MTVVVTNGKQLCLPLCRKYNLLCSLRYPRKHSIKISICFKYPFSFFFFSILYPFLCISKNLCQSITILPFYFCNKRKYPKSPFIVKRFC